MSEGDKQKARKWTDRGGTDWFVQRREAKHGLKAGWVLRRVGYSFVAYDDSAEGLTPERLQAWVDDHTRAGGGRGSATVRLWIDGRDGTEWEVFQGDGELVFQRGFESARTPRANHLTPPRSLDDDELRQALDEARSGA